MAVLPWRSPLKALQARSLIADILRVSGNVRLLESGMLAD